MSGPHGGSATVAACPVWRAECLAARSLPRSYMTTPAMAKNFSECVFNTDCAMTADRARRRAGRLSVGAADAGRQSAQRTRGYRSQQTRSVTTVANSGSGEVTRGHVRGGTRIAAATAI
jgi:hypothetical protein